MRALFLQTVDRMNARDRWLVGYAMKWLLLILVLVLYTLIIARASFAKAERKFEDWKVDWQVEYAEGFKQHMAAVEENMQIDSNKMERVEMMQEYWRKHK